MRIYWFFTRGRKCYFLILTFIFFGKSLIAQQTKITDYVIFGGQQSLTANQQAPLSPGYGVQLGSSCNIQGGSIGSYNLIKSTGNLTLGTNIYSGGIVQLANSNLVTGKIAAANTTVPVQPQPVLLVGSSTNISGNIDVKGSIVIGGGTVSGVITYPGPPLYSYSGPGLAVVGIPTLPTLPNMADMPAITTFPVLTPGSPFDFSTSQTIIPNRSYNNITLSGNKTLTFNGPGIYVINKILNSGTSNNFVFDFKNLPGKIIIYVTDIVDLGKVKASISGVTGFNNESRILLETHGTGTAANPVAFRIANGSAGSASKWVGSVWAPYAAINIGSGTGSTNITGALWSGTQVNIQSGISMTFAPFNFCEEIPANAGVDQIGAATCGLTSVTLAANNPSPGTGAWSIISGAGGSFGNLASTTSTFSGTGGVTYTLRWTITNGTCSPSSDDVVIKFNQNPTVANAGPDQIGTATCGLTSVTLAANTPVVGTGSWSKVSGTGGSFSNASSPISTFSGTAGNTYVLRWTISNSPCTLSSDDVTVTFSATPANVNAGQDKAMEFGTITKLKGSTSSTGATYHWVASNGGNISAGTNTDEITVTAAGTYTLTVTAGSCTASDQAIVTSKTKNLIGAELQSVYETRPTVSPFFIITGGYIMIDVIVENGKKDYVLNLLQQRTPTYPVDYGLRNFITNGQQGHIIITGEYPIINLLNLNTLDSVINYCRPYYQAVNYFDNEISGDGTSAITGLVVSAGDIAMRTNLVRSGYRLNGDSIKIGVMSNTYSTITSGTTATPPYVPTPGVQSFNTNTAAQDTANGDLPGSPRNLGGYTKPVHVLQDFPTPKSDEGRAMLQIIHDVAPGAELYFRTAYFTAGDFATGIYELADSGCNIIVDDITYITEPFLKDGVVAKAVDSVKKRGVTYFSAAGNFAGQSYETDFVPVDTSLIGFTNKKIHDFNPATAGPGHKDLFQHVRLAPGNYTVVFQWVDDIYSLIGGVAGTKYDMDIYLTPDTNTNGAGLIGFNRDNKDGDPIEIMPFTISGTDTADYNFLIVQNTDSTSSPARLKYIIFRGGMRIAEYNVGTSTLVGQANANGAIAVGAARYNKVAPYVPVPLLEDYSSIGGTKTNEVVRNKPDIVGPDGVNTTVKMGQDYPNSALDGYSNFFGTSAAAPHAAAAAALIMQGKRKFLNQNVSSDATTPNQIRSLLQSTAIDMSTAGFDYNSGYGFINTDSAMRTFAAPVSYLIQLVVPPGTAPCSGSTIPFTITITGENFSRSTIVLLINAPGDTTRIIPTYISSSEVSVTINGCIGNPEIRAYTPPKAGTNGKDGGYSNSVYFFDREIFVRVVDTTIRYGQTTPVFDTIITIINKNLKDTVLLQDTTLTLADIGLSNLVLNIPGIATNPATVGTYAITPITTVPIGINFLRQFNYKFIPGTFSIGQLPLTITALNIPAIIYGDDIPNIQFNYEFDHTGISNPDSLLTAIRTSHQNQLKKDGQGDDIFALVNGKAVQIDNGKAVQIDNGKAVQIDNGRVVTIEGGDTIPVVNAQALTIVNGVVTAVKEYQLDSTDIKNLNFLATDSSLNNIRQISNATGLTTVVDITQESILNFKVNAAQTYMLSSVSDVDAKGLVDDKSYTNGKAVQIDNGKAVQIDNGIELTVVNGKAVQIDNGQAVIILENGDTVPIVSSQSRTAVIVNVREVGDGITNMKSLSTLTGLSADTQYVIPGTYQNNNYNASYIAGTVNIKKDTITVTAENKQMIYGDTIPKLTLSYSGFAYGENLQTSGITGVPVLSTTATTTSQPNSYPITVTNGSLTSENYAFKFVNGTLTVRNDSCLLIRPPFNNFGSTPTVQGSQLPTSLWVNVAIKISGQLKTHGRYLLFTKGAITLKDIIATDPITNTQITTKELPGGKVMADTNVKNASQIYTQYSIISKTWTTHVPLGFSSTSDIFISGAIINSKDGFVKKKNNANSATIVQGVLSSDTVYSDQWTYALATYRPYFDYTAIAGTTGTGKVVAINGTYRAGTPLSAVGTPINTLVNGGSGGGGNNYTGSTSSFDNFTACCPTCPAQNLIVTSAGKEKTREEVLITPATSEVRIIPNPASDHITLSFVPAFTGRSKVILFTIEGKKVFESDYGVCEADRSYQKNIDVSRFINGIYMVQLWNADKIITKKIIVSR